MDITVVPGEGRRTPVGRRSDIIALMEGRLRFCGSGAYKSVFLSADGRFVYKRADVNDGCSCEDCEANGPERYDDEVVWEANRLNELRAQGHHWAAPTSLWYVDGRAISCQPAYQVADDLYSTDNAAYYRLTEKVNALAWTYFRDNHSGNYGQTRSGALRIFDGV